MSTKTEEENDKESSEDSLEKEAEEAYENAEEDDDGKLSPSEAAKLLKKSDVDERDWYVAHTYSGYEDAVARNLRQRIESMDMENKIFNVVVPVEKNIKVEDGDKKIVEEKIYPGYVLVDMIVTEQSWYVVRNTPRVTGFVGSGTDPVPVSKDELEKIRSKMSVEEPQHKIKFKEGDTVHIQEGPFEDMDGKVKEVDEKSAKVKVLVNMFGRETPVEVDYVNLKKI